MTACREELSVVPDNLLSASLRYHLALLDGEIVGYYAFGQMSATVWELETLFVEPSHIGCGIGRLLMEHAKKTALEAGAKEIVIQSDPHAERFYLAVGAAKTGQRPSVSIPGRDLPLFSIVLRQE